MKMIILIVAFTLSLGALAQNAERSGGSGGHGGDGYSLEFYQIGKSVLDDFNYWNQSTLDQLSVDFSINEFKEALMRAKVISTEESLYVNGIEVDAKNFSEDREHPYILINRMRWDRYKDDFKKKMGIVVHEYLGIIQGLFGRGEWDHYRLSEELLKNLNRDSLTMTSVWQEYKLNQLRASFQAAKRPLISQLTQNFPWTCTEVSSIKNVPTRRILHHAYSFIAHKGLEQHFGMRFSQINFELANEMQRKWNEYNPSEEKQDQNIYQEVMRVGSNGDVIVEVSSDSLYANQLSSLLNSNKGTIAYIHCSQLISDTVQKLQFMSDSLSPIFEMPKTQGFKNYQEKMKDLSLSKQYKSCVDKNNNRACIWLIKKLDTIKLVEEKERVQSAKNGIDQINKWLESLPDFKKQLVTPTVRELYNRYLIHQQNLKALLDYGDLPLGHKADPIGLKNFVEAIHNQVPQAYNKAGNVFQKETEKLKKQFILDHSF